MPVVQTFVFFDIETTGLPYYENNNTKITELSMVAVKRDHIIDTRPFLTPRVQHKITLCFNPGRLVTPESTKTTGLCNDLLEHEPYLKEKSFIIIDAFLSQLTKPVCLVAHNGDCFDFPVFKCSLKRIGKALQDDLVCVDSWKAFRVILESYKLNKNICPLLKDLNTQEEVEVKNIIELCNAESCVNNSGDLKVGHRINCESINENDSSSDHTKKHQISPNNFMDLRAINEKTPKSQKFTLERSAKLRQNLAPKSKRLLFEEKKQKLQDSYKLKDIYERLLQKQAVNCHRAESDCLLLLECAIVLKEDFIGWIDENCVLFSEIKPMEVGTPLPKFWK